MILIEQSVRDHHLPYSQNRKYVFANPSPNGRGCPEAAGEGYKKTKIP